VAFAPLSHRPFHVRHTVPRERVPEPGSRPAAIRRQYVVIIVAPKPLMFSGLPVSFGLFEVAADWSCVVDDVEAGNQPVLCQLSDVDDCG
jgi:hypothetical protein